MKLAIIGLERSGKTTVFNALTGSNKEVGTYGKLEANIAMVKVPDERIDWLSALYKPKKTTYANIEFMDIPGNINDTSDPKIVAVARESEALVYVIRSFDNPEVPHPHGTINPVGDYGYLDMGLIVADMSVVEKRLDKLRTLVHKSTDKQKEEKEELAVLEKLMARFEAEEPASEAELAEHEKKIVRAFQFLTLKPQITLLNISEDQIGTDETSKIVSELDNCLSICAKVEMEIEKLDENERPAFLESMGVKELSLDSFIRKAYDTLGLISFFTVGETDVRAWTITKGTSAQAAAGKIHSDLERGFIRAEVIAYKDLRELGSEKEVKSAGKLRLEGKDYIVQDGDIMNIKFNV